MSIILRTRIQLFHSDPSKIGDLVVNGAFTTSGVSPIAKLEEVGVFWSAAPARLALYRVLRALSQVNAHSVITARDLGIPAVIGTQQDTRKNKDGQRIRVDGNLLRVYIPKD